MGLRSVLKRYVCSKKGTYSIEEIADIVRPIAERYGVERVFIFGSYARGEECSDSDIDFLIAPGRVRGLQLGALYSDLSDALGVDIDLVTENGNQRFMSLIKRDAVLIYGS